MKDCRARHVPSSFLLSDYAGSTVYESGCGKNLHFYTHYDIHFYTFSNLMYLYNTRY